MSASLPIMFATSYLLGSLPSGYLAGRMAGVDIRQHGSGNIGATNVLRVLGKPYGVAVFVIDAGKGFVPVRIAYALFAASPHPEYYAIIAAVLVVLGHAFPVWLKFRGGKGVATSAGAVVALVPLAAAAAIAVWFLIFLPTRYVSLASIVAALSLPLICALMLHLRLANGTALLYFSVIIALLIVWRHRGNLARLRAGTEPRLKRE